MRSTRGVGERQLAPRGRLPRRVGCGGVRRETQTSTTQGAIVTMLAAGTSVPLSASAAPVTSPTAPLLPAVPVPTRPRETPPEPGELHSRLTGQVRAAVDDGQVIPCVGSDAAAWTSDDLSDQEQAADRCWDCPLVFQCRAYAVAAGETIGVWGGFAPEIERARNRRPHRPTREARQRAQERRRALRAGRKAEAEGRDCADAYAYILMEGGADKAQISIQIGYPTMNTKDTANEISTGCNCGCGEAVGRRAIYRPGHDAKHVSRLVAELFNTIQDGGTVTPAAITSVAKSLPSAALQAKFRRAAERLVAKAATDVKEAAK